MTDKLSPQMLQMYRDNDGALAPSLLYGNSPAIRFRAIDLAGRRFWFQNLTGAVGAQVTVTEPALTDFTHVVTSYTAYLATNVAGVSGLAFIRLRNGPDINTGPIILSSQAFITGQTVQAKQKGLLIGNQTLIGLDNTAVTFGFNAAVANVIQSVNMSGYSIPTPS